MKKLLVLNLLCSRSPDVDLTFEIAVENSSLAAFSPRRSWRFSWNFITMANGK